MPTKERRKMNDAVKGPFLDDAIYYEIIYALGVSIDDLESIENECIWEQINYSRIGHARILAYFFQKPLIKCTEKLDDVVSEDFSFDHRLLEGFSETDLEMINKGMFHLSLSRYDRRTRQQWEGKLLAAIHKRTIEFIQKTLSEEFPKGIVFDKPKWNNLLTILQSGHELMITCPDGKRTLSKGRKLGSDYSELTPVPPEYLIKLNEQNNNSNIAPAYIHSIVDIEARLG